MGSIFDNRKILHGFPRDGQKIKAITNKTNSWFIQVVEDTKKLEIGKEYTVLKTELNSSTSYVWLEEFGEDVFFNICSFEWELPEIDPNDLIGFFVLDLHMLSYKYGIGIQWKDDIRCDGSPMLVVKCENEKYKDMVTSAEFKN
jgi:hypothetical protein